MGILDRMQRSETRALPGNINPWWYTMTPGPLPGSGGGPNHPAQLTSVWQAVRIISQSISTMPLQVLDRVDANERRPVVGPLVELLTVRPNPWMTAVNFYEQQVTSVLLRGNSFAGIVRDNSGRPARIMPWHPDRVRLKVRGGSLEYHYYGKSGPEVWAQEDVLHVRGTSDDGLIGWSPITFHAHTLGANWVAERFAQRFFENAAAPSGILMHPSELSEKAQVRIQRSWERMTSGKNQHRVAVLEDGVQYERISVTPEEAQFLQTRKFNVSDIARIFNVPLHLLHELDRATFSNIEHLGQSFGRYSLRPWAVNYEQAIKATFFADQPQRYLRFNMDALLRPDTKTRAEARAIEFQNGAITLNEWRASEERNAYPDPIGDEPMVPANLIPGSLALNPPPEDTPPEPEDPPEGEDQEPVEGDEAGERGRLARELAGAGANVRTLRALETRELRSLAQRKTLERSYRRILAGWAQRVVDRETNEVRRAVRATEGEPSELRRRLENVYARDGALRQQMARTLQPIMESYLDAVYDALRNEVELPPEVSAQLRQDARAFVNAAVVRYVAASENKLRGLIDAFPDPQELVDRLLERLEHWQATRPEQVARHEATQGGNFLARAAMVAAGATALRWVAFGRTCPLCDSLDGVVVGREEPFLQEGGTVDPGEGTAPLTASRQIAHPPLHDGCDCSIIAG